MRLPFSVATVVIVHAAAELVAENGTAGMSLDDVLARAGASRSQLYHYFEDRDDLIRAVIGDTTDAVTDAQGDLLDHLDSWAGIDRWLDFHVQVQLERHAAGGCPIGSLVGQDTTPTPERPFRPALNVGKRISERASPA